MSAVLSAGLSALPLPPNEATTRLARELRVASMARAGDAIANVITGPLLQAFTLFIQGGAPGTSEIGQLEGSNGGAQVVTNDGGGIPQPAMQTQAHA